MKTQLTYSEITEYMHIHVGRDVALSYVSEQSIRVVTELEYRLPLLGRKTLNVDANVTLKKIVGTDLYLSYSFPNHAMESAVNVAYNLFSTTLSRKLPMVEKLDGNNLIVHLSEVRQLSKALDVIEIDDVQFSPSEVLVNIKLKALM